MDNNNNKPKRKRFKRNTRPTQNHGNQNRKKHQGRDQRPSVDQYIEKNRATKPEKAYETKHKFSDFDLHDSLKTNIARRDYETPTEVQDKTIPEILTGKDLIGIAGTGTGKTAAFLIPVIQDLITNPHKETTLIITPTRELASQIFEEFKQLTKGMKLYTTCLIGGASVGQSIKDLRRTNHVIIGTPGRLIDMVDRDLLPLQNFKTLVLDEFDRMLDMGFQDDVKYLNDRMTNKSQTLLFSATMDASQKSIVEKMTNNPVEVKGGKGPQMTQAIEQEVVRVPKEQKKMDVLQEVIEAEQGQKVLLFCETKRTVDQVHRNLLKGNVRADMIHGDKTQKAREKALGKFRKGWTNVLVATDVVARGIDVTDISMVINYEVPGTYNDYLHRIGRTGRAGKSGKAVTLVD